MAAMTRRFDGHSFAPPPPNEQPKQQPIFETHQSQSELFKSLEYIPPDWRYIQNTFLRNGLFDKRIGDTMAFAGVIFEVYLRSCLRKLAQRGDLGLTLVERFSHAKHSIQPRNPDQEELSGSLVFDNRVKGQTLEFDAITVQPELSTIWECKSGANPKITRGLPHESTSERYRQVMKGLFPNCAVSYVLVTPSDFDFQCSTNAQRFISQGGQILRLPCSRAELHAKSEPIWDELREAKARALARVY